jgi:hypothetical protein
MAKAKRRTFEKQYLQVPNETATAPEVKTITESISLEALGLIVNICSYSEEWELHKTELYKRFANNKRTSVSNAWKELTEANYIFEYKYRDGKKWEYVYLYDITPYTSEQIEILRQEALDEHEEIWDVDFAHPKMDSSKPTANKYKRTKDELKKDEKSSFVNKENQVDRENSFKDELINIADNHYSEFASGRWSKDQWFTITNKLTDEIIEKGTKITNPSSYIYSALKGIAYKHDLKKGRIDFESRLSRGEVPFYNWLEDIESDE